MTDLKNFSSLSVLDFIYDTKDMSVDEFIAHSLHLKLKLQKVLDTEATEFWCLQLEIQHLIDFIGQVCWKLQAGSKPESLKPQDEDNYNIVIGRYYPNEVLIKQA